MTRRKEPISMLPVESATYLLEQALQILKTDGVKGKHRKVSDDGRPYDLLEDLLYKIPRSIKEARELRDRWEIQLFEEKCLQHPEFSHVTVRHDTTAWAYRRSDQSPTGVELLGGCDVKNQYLEEALKAKGIPLTHGAQRGSRVGYPEG